MPPSIISGYPLSLEQALVWDGIQSHGEAAYRSRATLGVRGPFDGDAFRRALQTVIERHEILRTRFVKAPALVYPLQVVGSPAFEWNDLGNLSEQPRSAIEETLAESDARPFDVAGPLFRVTCAGVTRSQSLVQITSSALCLDARGLHALIEELMATYAGHARLDGPEPAFEYADYVQWQRGHEDETGRPAEQWRDGDRLPGELTVPEQAAFAPTRLAVRLPPRLAAAVVATGLPVPAVLFSCWYVLLARLTAHATPDVGVAVDWRSRFGVQGAPGLFSQVHPCAFAVRPAASIAETVQRAAAAMAAAAASGRRDLPVCFSIDESSGPWRARGARFRLRALEACTARFKLKLSCLAAGHRLTAHLCYDASRFDRTTVAAVARMYVQLLTHAAAMPACAVGSLPVVSALEGDALVRSGAGPVDTRKPLLVHELFERQVIRRPGAIAVTSQSGELSFRELNHRAERVAKALSDLGVGPDVPVPIMLERSLDMPVAILGVLKSGGAFVPMDPLWPPGRVRQILQRTGARVVLTTTDSASGQSNVGVRVLHVDSISEGGNDHRAPVKPGLHNLAYIMHTSGSTGVPKGVMIPHGALSNHMRWMQARLPLTPDDRVLQKTAFTFDASVWEFFAPLLAGATLVLAPPDAHRDPAVLSAALTQEAITILQVVPAQLKQLIDGVDPDACPSLKRVFCGGGPLPPDLCERFHRRFTAALHNLYGPTEATIDATLWTPPRRPAPSALIGRPISNVRAYVLDSYLQPVPPGIAGELCLGGAALARGYLREAGLTAERFVPDPFPGRGGQRIYRTGDLARWTDDGQLAFLGRADGQVKFLGYRIELAEIERALQACVEVRDAAAACRQDDKGGESLVAYVVPAGVVHPSLDRLRTELRSRLPEHMIPTNFVFLDALPCTRSGKVDRQALPAPCGQDVELTTPYVEPEAGVERELTGIWATALGIDRVGALDDFFELGGHSLLAASIVSTIRTRFARRITLADFLQCGTVRQLAIQLRASAPPSADAGFPRVDPVSARRFEPFPLSGMQDAYAIGRTAAFELGNVSSHEYFEVDCVDLDLARFERAWQRVIDRHDELRAVMLADGQQRVLRETAPYRIEVCDLRGASADVVVARLQTFRDEWSHEVRPPGEWPLFAVRATRIDEHRTRLHFGIDLIICDARSLQIIVDECVRIYRSERVADAPELTFRDYVLAERQLRASEPYERSRAYWQARVLELPPAPALPLACVPSTIAHPRFVRRTFELAPAAWRRLKARGARVGLAPAGLLLTAYADVLAYWSASQRLTINLPVSNRLPLHSQVNDVVGDFTSLGLLGVEGSVGERFEVRAERLQRQLWRDLDHRYVGGVDVLRELARQRGMDAARMPVVFTSTLGLAGREVSEALGRLGRVVYRVTQTPQVWLDALVSEREQTLVVDWDVVDALFPAGVVDEMFGAYRDCVERLATSDASWTDVGRAGLLPPHTRAQRAAGNATARAVPAATLGGLVRDRAAAAPEACAVVSGTRRMTYGELSRRAQRVADELAAHGVAAASVVPVVMDKSWTQVVAVVGVAAHGAAYVPLDPGWPRARLWRLLQHSEARVVLTQQRWAATLRWPGDVRCVCVDQLEDGRDGLRAAGGGELAYVLYTSGSTGDPKGVVIEQRGVVNAIVATNDAFGVTAADGVLALTALTHDMSVYDVFGMLAAGGRVVLPEAGREKDPGHWLTLLGTEGVTIWNSVPAYLEMLLDYGAAHGAGLPASWRLALLGGDWVAPSLVARLRREVPGIEVVSVGGPTETTLWNIWHRVKPGDAPIPYGRPIANTRYEIVNEGGEPCPTWVKGEMWCSGVGVMRGYWRDQARTRAVIVEAGGERYYRTGDVGWYEPDGTIAIGGRTDLQVKVHGQRIEVEEIEAMLRDHADVKQAAVTVAGDGMHRHLVAYVEMRSGAPIERGQRV
jgi:amino acid adenylation domain-containing protein